MVYVTDERTEKYLRISLNTLLKKEAKHIKVIPLFISTANPRYQLARELLSREQLVVPVPSHWERITEQAVAGFEFKSLQVVIAYSRSGEEAEQDTALREQALANSRATQQLDDKTKAIVVPFHFGPKHDSMMSFDMKLKRLLPTGMQLLSYSKSSIENLVTWLQREANLNQSLTLEDTGVIFLAHGSDFDWNEQMRKAVRLLMDRYKIEFAFSMADQFTIERAIRKLERRGAKAAIIVRVFALEESFRHDIERMIDLDIENKAQKTSDPGASAGYEQMHHGATKAMNPHLLTGQNNRRD